MSTSSSLDTRQRHPKSRGTAPPPPPPRVSSLLEKLPGKRTSEYYPQNSQTPLAQRPARPPLPPLPISAEKSDRLSNLPAKIPALRSSYPQWKASLECPQDLSSSAAVTHRHASYKLQPTPHGLDQSEAIMPSRPYYIDVKPISERTKSTTRGLIPASSPPRTSMQQSPTRIDTDDGYEEELTIFPQHMDIPKIPVPLAPKFRRYKRPISAKYQQPHSPEHRAHFAGFELPKSRQIYLPQPAFIFTNTQPDSLDHKRQAEVEKDLTKLETSVSSRPHQARDLSQLETSPSSRPQSARDLTQLETSVSSRPHPARDLSQLETSPSSRPQSARDLTQLETSVSTVKSDDSSTGIGDYSGFSFNPELFKRFGNITSSLRPSDISPETPTTQRTPTKSSPSLLQDPTALDGQNLNPYAKPGPPDPYVGCSVVVGLTKSTFKDFIKDLSAAFVLFYNPCDPNCNWAKVNMKKAALVTQRENHVFAAVDCTKECKLCKKQRVVAFPTMKLFARGQSVATFTDDTILSSRQMTDFVENTPELSPKKGCQCFLQ